MKDETRRPGPGRPPLDAAHRSVNVHFRLPSPQYDALCQRAQRERVTVGELIRRKLEDDETNE